MKRILFVEIEIDRETERKLFRALGKITGGDGILEDVPGIADRSLRCGGKIKAPHPAEPIAPREKPNFMR